MEDSGAMTPVSHDSFVQAMAHAAEHHQIEMWRAAETVRSHVQQPEERAALLDCLGLTDLARPAGL
jgi:hypothetical protein